MDIANLIELSRAERISALESRDDPNSAGDFTGTVSGTWVRLDESGAGVVSYNNKQYKTKRIGFISIPAGTIVALSYADGIYYSTW